MYPLICMRMYRLTSIYTLYKIVKQRHKTTGITSICPRSIYEQGQAVANLQTQTAKCEHKYRWHASGLWQEYMTSFSSRSCSSPTVCPGMYICIEKGGGGGSLSGSQIYDLDNCMRADQPVACIFFRILATKYQWTALHAVFFPTLVWLFIDHETLSVAVNWKNRTRRERIKQVYIF